MSLFNSGTRSSLLRQAINRRTTARAGPQFSTSASGLQIRADSTFFSSNNARLNSGIPLARQQAGQGAQRWEGTLRGGPGAKRNFSVSYGSLGEQVSTEIYLRHPQLNNRPTQLFCSSFRRHSTSWGPSIHHLLYPCSSLDRHLRHSERIPKRADNTPRSWNRNCKT